MTEDVCMSKVFSQVLLFQVKPDQLDAFETLLRQVQAEQEGLPGCRKVHYMKRFYTFDDVTSGEPPRPLTKIIKCVKYFGVLSFDSIEDCGQATSWLFANYGKQITKMCIMPFDIHSGYEI